MIIRRHYLATSTFTLASTWFDCRVMS